MSSSAHWLKPVRPASPKGRHVLLYVQEKQYKGRTVAGIRNCWRADVADTMWDVQNIGDYKTLDQLDNLLGQVCLPKGETTLWVLRGWTDMVLTGLVELMDAGVITWRYVSFSGRSCIVKGAWRGRKITITSIPNWTGNRWDSWGDCYKDKAVARLMTAIPPETWDDRDGTVPEEKHAVEKLAAIVATCNMLSLPRIPPTAGAAGLLLWRTWLGPRIVVIPPNKTGQRKPKKEQSVTYVAPIPSRPDKAANAERHICYSLSSKQLREGHVNETIYCMDLRSAYLVGLSMTPLPIVFDKTLHSPSTEELANKLQLHTGLALVRVQSEDWYYPCCLDKKVVQCKGRFWTWLAGVELVHALCYGHIKECWTAYLWHADLMSDQDRQLIDRIKIACDNNSMTCVAAGWRSVYSALVGRFAGWQRIWQDSPAYAGFGRWSQWMQAAHKDGVIVPHRSVAGKVQYLAEKTDKQDSVPLLFGCVTSMVRWLMQKLANIVGYEHIYCTAADCLWLDKVGWQKVQRQISESGLAPDNVRVKHIYDRAWLSGKSVVVTERNGIRELHMPGVSNGAVLDSNGQVIVEHTDDWDSDGEPTARKGIRRRKHRYTATKVVEKYSFPARVLSPGETVSIPLLGQSLLKPLYGERTVEDA